ncbi:hypothetical protein M3J09_009088 [Ascochyta lentis]
MQSPTPPTISSATAQTAHHVERPSTQSVASASASASKTESTDVLQKSEPTQNDIRKGREEEMSEQSAQNGQKQGHD